MRAHTVQKSGGLSRIARDGHVYAARANLIAIKKAGGSVPFQLTGINRASTFTGFCGKHDASLFRAIETEPFAMTKEQMFLYAYRPLCRELFQKKLVNMNADARSRLDRGLPVSEQIKYQVFDSAYANSTGLAIRDSVFHKDRYDKALLEGIFDDVRGVVIEFDRVPSVLASSALFPEFDFQGRVLQDFRSMKHLDAITFSMLPTDAGGVAILSWLGDQPASERLADSLLLLDPADIPDAVLRFTFEFFENTFVAPVWWEALPSQACNRYLRRLNEAGNPLVVRSPRCLMDDGLRTADWKVVAAHRI